MRGFLSVFLYFTSLLQAMCIYLSITVNISYTDERTFSLFKDINIQRDVEFPVCVSFKKWKKEKWYVFFSMGQSASFVKIMFQI